MIWNDTTNGQGLIQGSEADCGLGATGISSDTQLFKDFTRWGNDWHKRAFSHVMLAFDGHDLDDPGYNTAPTGTFTGRTDGVYIFDSTYKFLKLKLAEFSFDGTNYVRGSAFDDAQTDISVKDPNVGSKFSASSPQYDLIASGFKQYPLFTQAQVTAGAKVYVEWYRAPREFATSGTDNYEPGLDLQFHKVVQLGMSWEYCSLYLPEKANKLAIDLFGNNGNIKGMWNEMTEWYSRKQPGKRRIVAMKENNR